MRIMTTDVKYNSETRIIDIVHSGTLTAEKINNATSEALALHIELGVNAVLLDASKLESVANLTDFFDLPKQYDQGGASRNVRIAQVMPEANETIDLSEVVDTLQFYENVCNNRGWIVRTFYTRDEAIEWLLEKKTVLDYPGNDTTVSWHRQLCIHVGECGRAKGDLFIGGRDPWCQPDVASAEEVSDVISRCPTGALTVDFADGSGSEQPEAVNTVNVAYNGPLFVRGRLSIDHAPDDAPGLAFRAALCRCGKSRNKPFCDNSHEKDGFSDYGAVGETGNDDSSSGGELTVKPVKDGPLMLNGNLTIRNSSGRDAWHGDRVALCRCGESANKPFCDGAHKRVGFSSD